MTRLLKFFIVFLLISLYSCGSTVSTTVTKSYDILNYQEEIMVFEVGEEVPESSELLGTVRIGETGFSIKCSYEVVVNEASQEARKVGGNAIKIVEHNKPDFWSSCHRITAEIFRIEK